MLEGSAMASYYGHVTFSTGLGIAYGGAALYFLGTDTPTALGAAFLTAVSGMLPDLDSDSGVPVRALFGAASVVVPLIALRRLLRFHLPIEQVLLVMFALHYLIRYGIAYVFTKLTVHRGMFHSVPAMFISGMAVFLLYHDPVPFVRVYMAGAVMLGFLSHLVLDELCSVNLAGVSIKESAGTALKFFSPSWKATLACYTILLGLTYCTALEFEGPRRQLQAWLPNISWTGIQARGR
jgi:hypothetical protein